MIQSISVHTLVGTGSAFNGVVLSGSFWDRNRCFGRDRQRESVCYCLQSLNGINVIALREWDRNLARVERKSFRTRRRSRPC
jgi:hypothetical protein